METIGSRIRALRQGRLTQAQLAELVHLDQSTISDIEKGAGFAAEVLMALAAALESTPEYIMRGETPDAAVEAEASGLLRLMDADGRKSALGSLRGIAAERPIKEIYTKRARTDPPHKELKLITKAKKAKTTKRKGT